MSSNSQTLTNQLLSNIITIENIDEIKDSFKKKVMKKGKLRLGPYWTAYNRENLGSIPRKVENIIINERQDSVKKGFMSNTSRFFKHSETVKHNFPGPGAYDSSNNSTIDKSGISVYSTKGFGNGFVSSKARFDDYLEFKSKYLPSPSDYNINTHDINKTVENSLNYKSLYSNSKYVSLKEKVGTPGPGFYNTNNDNLKTDHNATTSNFFFKSTSTRFNIFGKPEKTVSDFNKTQFTTNTISTNYSTKYNNFNTTGSDKKYLTTNRFDEEYLKTQTNMKWNFPRITDVSKNNDEVKTQYLTTLSNDTSKEKEIDKFKGGNLINNAYEASTIKGKQKEKNMKNRTISHFFQEKIESVSDPLINLGVKKQEPHLITKPGPGTYETISHFGKKDKEVFSPNLHFQKFQREAFKQRLKTKPKKKKNKQKNDFYSTYSCFNTEKTALNLSSVFSSNSPKVFERKNKNPGPAYYSPKVSPSKTSFNNNKTQAWMAL
jgi:hypothetical protein